MVTFSTSLVITELEPNSGYKEITVTTPAVSVSGDTLTLTLSDYGISETGFLTINGYVQTTTSSVVATEAPTTAVASGVLTITPGAGTGIKFFRILGKSN